MDHTMLARVLSKNAEIMSILIEVYGMNAANMQRAANGEAMAYTELEFSKAANEVQGRADELFEMSF